MPNCLLSGFIDRSDVPTKQGPYQFIENTDGLWTCETGILDGHKPNAIQKMTEDIPIFKDGDFSKLTEYIRPDELRPNHDQV